MNTEIVTAPTAPVTPISENPKQPQQRQTAKEIIAANVKSLIEQLEAGHSDALTAYLDAMSRFHNYSFGNILEIARQKPTATRVAGLYAWNQLGRKVRKGERGIRILAPIVGIKRKKDEEAERDITRQNTRVLVGFRNAYVFDRLSRDLRPAWPGHRAPPQGADVRHAPRWQQPHHRSVRRPVARRSGCGRVPVRGQRSVLLVRCVLWLRLDFVDGSRACDGRQVRRSSSVERGCSRGRVVLWGSVLPWAERRGAFPYRAGCNWRRRQTTLRQWGS